jgi:hypothetical protein
MQTPSVGVGSTPAATRRTRRESTELGSESRRRRSTTLPAVIAVTGPAPAISTGAGGGGPGAGIASAAVGVAVAAVSGARLSRANRYSFGIMELPIFKPLGLASDFVPQKSCLEYVLDECARALPVIRPHVQALVQAAREVNSGGG